MEFKINFLLNIITLFAVIYIAFIKSYFSEKGKNVATKEDIGDITREVEDAKQIFNKSLEQFKNDLNLSTQVRFTIKSAEIEALLNLYEKYFIWYNSLQTYSVPSLKEPFNNNTLQIIDKSYLDFLIAESKAELFIKEFESFQIKHELKSATLDLNKLISPFHIQTEWYNFRYTQLDDIKSFDERMSKFEQLKKEYWEIHQKFYEDKLNCCKPINELSITFRMKLLEELKKLVEQ